MEKIHEVRPRDDLEVVEGRFQVPERPLTAFVVPPRRAGVLLGRGGKRLPHEPCGVVLHGQILHRPSYRVIVRGASDLIQGCQAYRRCIGRGVRRAHVRLQGAPEAAVVVLIFRKGGEHRLSPRAAEMEAKARSLQIARLA